MHGLMDRMRRDGVSTFDVTRALAGQNIFTTAVKTASAA
jgi:hypothetical protein